MRLTFKVLDLEPFDGNSFNLTLDLGFHMVYHRRVGLYGIDTSKLRNKRTAVKFINDWVSKRREKGNIFFVSRGYKGKHEHVLGDIEDQFGFSLSLALVKAGYYVEKEKKK